MGAEQVGFLTKGPRRILARKIRAAARVCQQHRTKLMGALGEATAPEARRELALEQTGEDFDPADIPEDPEAEIRSFVDWWNHMDGRDVCSRQDPDDSSQILVYAGEMSCGDEPQGHGYHMLKRAFDWGFAEALGIR